MSRAFTALLCCFAAACGVPPETEELAEEASKEQDLALKKVDGTAFVPPGSSSFDYSGVVPMILYKDIKEGGTSSHTRSVDDLATKTWSTGGVVANTASSVYVPPGREATVCTESWYRGTCHTFTPNSPGNVWVFDASGVDENVESVEYRPLGGFDWDDYDYLSNYPHDRENELSPDIQGVAHNADHWFIARQGRLLRIPLGTSLADSSFDVPKIDVDEMPGHCDHIGDIDYYSGELFVPLEQCDGDNLEGNDRIAVFRFANDGSFVLNRMMILGTQTHASWVAINPINGLMYSSTFNPSGNLIVRVYDRNFADGTLMTQEKFSVQLDRHHDGVQGGVFDDRGNLYLTEDASSGAGIYAYRIKGNRGYSYDFIGPNGYHGGLGQEVEGIDWFDLSKVSTTIPGIDTGPGAAQLHWLLLGNGVNASNDAFWFKHVRLHN